MQKTWDHFMKGTMVSLGCDGAPGVGLVHCPQLNQVHPTAKLPE